MKMKFAIHKSIVQRHGMTTVGLGQAYISFEKENTSTGNLSEYGQRDYPLCKNVRIVNSFEK